MNASRPLQLDLCQLSYHFGINLMKTHERILMQLDLSIDGADEVDPDLNLVKGRGGALLREKASLTATSISLYVK